MRPSASAEQEQHIAPVAPIVPPVEKHTTATAPSTTNNGEKAREKGDEVTDARSMEGRSPSVGQGPGPGDPNRTVTCMRCQESMPFLLVPSHGAKCKGKKENGLHLGGTDAASPPVVSEKQGLPSRVHVKSAEGEPNSRTTVAEKSRPRPADVEVVAASHSHSSISSNWTKNSSPLTSPRDQGISRPLSARTEAPPPLSPPTGTAGAKGWQGASRPGDEVPVSPEVKVPLSPSRWKAVRTWGTRQVTSWLRDIMRPPRADVISRFHDSGIDGATLLGITDRYRALVEVKFLLRMYSKRRTLCCDIVWR